MLCFVPVLYDVQICFTPGSCDGDSFGAKGSNKSPIISVLLVFYWGYKDSRHTLATCDWKALFLTAQEQVTVICFDRWSTGSNTVVWGTQALCPADQREPPSGPEGQQFPASITQRSPRWAQDNWGQMESVVFFAGGVKKRFSALLFCV